MKSVIIYKTFPYGIMGGIYNNIFRTDFDDEYGPADEKIICYIPLTVSGNSYQERKQDLYNKAVEWSNSLGYYPNWSYSELATVSSFFEHYGKKYGLLTEFRENAIC